MLGNKGTKKHYRTGGTRGGQDQFKWDDVKTDKYRENYLGHSAMAPIGRWQKGKDILWYTKEGAERDRALKDEHDAIKQADEDLINEALGLKPKKRKFVETKLEQDELKQLFGRGETERASVDIERIEGLGAAPAKVHEHIERGLTHLEKEILRLKEEKSGDRRESNEECPSETQNTRHEDSDSSDSDRRSRRSKKDKKKKDKKEKKERKEKKEKKSKRSRKDSY